jgi:putative ABC transport system permease protein
MRSLLTSLGIIIGVGSVIIMVAVGEGAQREIENRMTAMGTNLIQIMPRRVRMMMGPGQSFSGAMPRPNRITLEDLHKVNGEAGYVLAISGYTQRNYTVAGPLGSYSVRVQGCEPAFQIVRDWDVTEGIFFDESDLEGRNKVIVLGQTTAANLYGDSNPLGAQLKIGDNHYTIIGLMDKKGNDAGGGDQDDIILMPLNTALYRLQNSTNLGGIMMKAAGKGYMEAAQRDVEAILREAHGLDASATADFEIMNQAQMIDMASETSRSLTSLLAAIAGVSLLVGGIGIMNIMLVSVTERTREIGIRMSIGARKRDILLQFLSEAIILSLLGGVIGIALAFGVCQVLGTLGIATAINPMIVSLAAAFAALVGIVFGFYPARKAARLYPIDALRYE